MSAAYIDSTQTIEQFLLGRIPQSRLESVSDDSSYGYYAVVVVPEGEPVESSFLWWKHLEQPMRVVCEVRGRAKVCVPDSSGAWLDIVAEFIQTFNSITGQSVKTHKIPKLTQFLY